MFVGVESFGSMWVRRPGPDPRHDVYLNTTGIFDRGRLRYRTRVRGMVRFHCSGGFHPYSIRRNIGRVFECGQGVQDFQGARRVLLERTTPDKRPDLFLVATRSQEIGWIEWQAPGQWSATAFLVALSETNQEQEALWLLPLHAWILAERGSFFLDELPEGAKSRAQLRDASQ